MFRLISAFLIVLLISGHAWAAITFESVTNSAGTQGVLTVTTSVVVPSCTNCVLFACVINAGNTGLEPTGLTFNTSENFTRINGASRSNGGVEHVSSMWRLVNPTVTTANAVVTFNATSNNDRSLGASFLILHGVDQSTPVEASAVATGLDTTPTQTVDTVTADAWVMDCAIGDHNVGLTVGGSADMRVDRVVGTSSDSQGVATITVVSPGTQAMSWTQTSDDWAITVAAIKAHVAAAANIPSNSASCLLLMGSGC